MSRWLIDKDARSDRQDRRFQVQILAVIFFAISYLQIF